jgi:hypothetical protein
MAVPVGVGAVESDGVGSGAEEAVEVGVAESDRGREFRCGAHSASEVRELRVDFRQARLDKSLRTAVGVDRVRPCPCGSVIG